MPFSKIAFIAPYKGIYDLAMNLRNENEMNFQILLGDLDEGVKVAKQAIKAGAQVIVSRGGTASLIRKEITIPLIEVEVSSYDIMKALITAKDISSSIGVIGFSNVVHGVDQIGRLLHIPLWFYELQSEKEIMVALRKAKNQGIDIILGDAIAIREAEQLGLRGSIISSGKGAIHQAILEAKRIYEALKLERERSEQFQAIVQFSHNGILAVNAQEIVQVFNPRAEEILGIKLHEILGNKLPEILSNLKLKGVLRTGVKEIGQIQKLGNRFISVNSVPIVVHDQVVGAIAAVQDVTEIQKAEERLRKEIYQKGLNAKAKFEDIKGSSSLLHETVGKAKRYAKSQSTVLILGESGTGKELFAQSIHNASPLKNGPFVAVNCAALPETLLESELFGYSEGAFTGANKRGKAGLFEIAHNGTLFLDEIGEMPFRLQAYLLRVLQEGEVRKIGDDKVIPVHVRVIAATNVDLWKSVQEGKFRTDLFYRLNILTLQLPALRERKEDVSELIFTFMNQLNEKFKTNKRIHDQALRLLHHYDWPGNIRELHNLIERLFVIAEENEILPEHITKMFQGRIIEEAHLVPVTENDKKISSNLLQGTLEEIDKRIVQMVLEEEKGNISKTAKRLGVHRSTLYRKISH